MTQVDDDEVLLLWRALHAFRSGGRAPCAPRGNPSRSRCPLFAKCPRWSGPDDQRLAYDETVEETEARRSAWPCSRILDALGPDVRAIS
jgi:hypothetical protein